MHNVALYFDNNIDQIPFVLVKQNGVSRIYRDFRKFRLLPDTITLGFGDAIDSLRRLQVKRQVDQKRIEIVFALNIGYSKGDQTKKWQFRKQDIIGSKLSKELTASIKKYDNSEIGWEEFSPVLFAAKNELLDSVETVYSELVIAYSSVNAYRQSWLDMEHKIDSYFMQNQFDGIEVDRQKIEKLLKDLNFQKYSALLYLEQNHNLDISSAYLSDEYISSLVLQDVKELERTEELGDLIQVLDGDDKRIDAISKVRECKIDFANLIKHYSLDGSQCIYPQYDTIASSSGRIFISSPGTQYLKKSMRDIFVTRPGFRLCYFDFRNYEPGITAGLSGDQLFIEYYSSGDMYLKIATELYRNPSFRKQVKFAILASLYGMSPESLAQHFVRQRDFDPHEVVGLLESFNIFQMWKKAIIDSAVTQKEVIELIYTRKFTPERIWKAKTSALNHVIQSTGSRILKKCINDVSQLPGVRVLIPMHDALLCELSLDNYAEIEDQIVSLMESVFRSEVINVTSKVVVGNFCE